MELGDVGGRSGTDESVSDVAEVGDKGGSSLALRLTDWEGTGVILERSRKGVFNGPIFSIASTSIENFEAIKIS